MYGISLLDKNKHVKHENKRTEMEVCSKA